MTQIGDDFLADVRRGLADTGAVEDPAALAAVVRREAGAYGTGGMLAALGQVTSEIVGAGPLQPLLAQPGVTDVLVNGPGRVWVDRGRGIEESDIVIAHEPSLRQLATRLVGACGRRLDDAAPYADARLPDGTRVHAVLPPLAPGGTCLSLRIPPRQTFTLEGLVRAGSMPAQGAELMERLVAARLAFVVTGGTGTGKTTVLSTLLSLVAPTERLVLVEDAAELRPHHPHVVRLESRLANAEGVGAVNLDILVRQALRMRPDRLVVGEVRGREVLDLLSALNTGHDGGCSTVHANRTEHVPARFEALCAAAGLDRGATHSQLAAAIEVVIHLVRGRDGGRRVAGVAVLTKQQGGVVAEPAYGFAADGLTPGPAAVELERRLRRAE